MLAITICGVAPGEALAHAADRGHVLLLPTGYYLFGGAAAVAITFAVLSLAPTAMLRGFGGMRLPLGAVPAWPHLAGSLASLTLLVLLLAAGVAGSRDPLSNPLPLMVWTVFWVGLTLVQGVAGDLWWWINPWYAPSRLLAWLTGRQDARALPERLGYWPAVVQFFGFAWFELVYPAPDDPARLAVVLGVYFVVNLVAAAAFGYEAWMRQGECLSAFMRVIARLGVLGGADAGDGRRRNALRWPGAGLADAPPLPPSGVVFVLLALASVSFDGLMRTFFWLGLNGVNPLEFPGRSALASTNTGGLLMTAAALCTAFAIAVFVGERMTTRPVGLRVAAGALVWSIVPIAMAYHFSHYLVALVINGQYALAALSDPLMNGADLFGTAGMHVQAGALMGAEMAWMVWNLQAAAIIGGHLLAVLVAHVIAWRLHGSAVEAAGSQMLVAILMVFYTVFGLWLLSSPTGA